MNKIEQWMKLHNVKRSDPRHRKVHAERVTKDFIGLLYYIHRKKEGCVRCGAKLQIGGNHQTGGVYLQCSGPNKWNCYWISWDSSKNGGTEKAID